MKNARLLNKTTRSRPGRSQSFEAKILASRPLWPRGLNITGKNAINFRYYAIVCVVSMQTTQIMRTKIYWLDVPERIKYKLVMLIYRCPHNKAPRCLMDHCTSVSDVAYRQRLRSAIMSEVSVPRHRLSTYGRRAFAVAGPTIWNFLLEDMRDTDVSEDSYRQSLKTFLFAQY